MALIDLLPICPLCGHDPLEGKGPRAHCTGCDAGFDASRIGGIRVRDGEGERVLDESGLLERVDGMGLFVRSSAVTLARAAGEKPVLFDEQLLGFRELLLPPIEGTLRLTDEELHFEPGMEGESETFRLDELRALQGASSSLQLSFVDGSVVLLCFPDTSPRRWEVALQNAVRAIWRGRGRGEIEEFQPWIRIPEDRRK